MQILTAVEIAVTLWKSAGMSRDKAAQEIELACDTRDDKFGGSDADKAADRGTYRALFQMMWPKESNG